MIGCSILNSMLQEYATTVKSSDVGLAWEVHFKVKKQFEVCHFNMKRLFTACLLSHNFLFQTTDLLSIFEFCIIALKELTPTLMVPLAPDRHNLVCIYLNLHICKTPVSIPTFVRNIHFKVIFFEEIWLVWRFIMNIMKFSFFYVFSLTILSFLRSFASVFSSNLFWHGLSSAFVFRKNWYLFSSPTKTHH